MSQMPLCVARFWERQRKKSLSVVKTTLPLLQKKQRQVSLPQQKEIINKEENKKIIER